MTMRDITMHFPNLTSMLRAYRTTPATGAVALILVEDDVAVARTIAHCRKIGFSRIITFADSKLTFPEADDSSVWCVDYDVLAEAAVPTICNAMIGAAPGTWFYFGFNAEYLLYPFCEYRSVTEMLAFMAEERRDVVVCATIDLYAKDLAHAPDGVDHETAHFDGSGYYALPRQDAEGGESARQVNVYGGLRWRFEEHIPKVRQRVDRAPFFRARKGLQMLPDRSFNVAEYNTFSCPWHHNLSGAVASFRTAKALRRNPGSRDQITTFHCPQSVPFSWQSQQLLDLGFMEPGQWF